MGMNYYARIIPTNERKKELCELINKTHNFDKIIDEIHETYGEFKLENNLPFGGVVHLGKKSIGWKFLWKANVYIERHGHLEKIDEHCSTYVMDNPTLFFLYPLTKQGITDFVMRDDIEIYNEDNELIDKQDFLNLGFSTDKQLYDIKTYYKDNPKVRRYYYHNEIAQLLEENGITFQDGYYEEFYSDGLRFSTSECFS